MSNAHVELWKTGPVMKSTLNIGWTKDEYQRHRLKKKAKEKKKQKEQEVDVDKIRKLIELCDLLLTEKNVTKQKIANHFNTKYNNITNLLITAENNGLLLWESYNEVGELNAKEWKDKWKQLVV